LNPIDREHEDLVKDMEDEEKQVSSLKTKRLALNNRSDQLRKVVADEKQQESVLRHQLDDIESALARYVTVHEKTSGVTLRRCAKSWGGSGWRKHR
jgi:uncharacterized protein YlxW (UPF0749 family)